MSVIRIVVVLYQVAAEESATLRALREIFQRSPGLLNSYALLLWDNSPVTPPPPSLHVPFEYRHAERNEGVAGAYNAAAEMAREHGQEWLLLLDHDTEVTEEFLRAMLRHADECTPDKNVAAIVPYLFQGGFRLSPRYVLFSRHAPVPADRRGVELREVFAANSGALMRVAALDTIGGYSRDFWLDYSDIYVFHQFHRRGLSVYLAADARLQHDIAMTDYDHRMSPERYRNYLLAEGAFHDLYKGHLENSAQLLRLLARSVLQLRLRNPEFSRLTLRTLGQRLLVRRKQRLALWRADNERRRG